MKRFITTLLISLGAAALVSAQAPKPPETAILTGSPLGAVKLAHSAHLHYGAKCDSCHHASKPEKPLKAPQEKCTDCHTKVAAAPMKTKTQAAFHDPMAKSGTCIDCHQKAIAAGKPAPSKCGDCHKKANG